MTIAFLGPKNGVDVLSPVSIFQEKKERKRKKTPIFFHFQTPEYPEYPYFLLIIWDIQIA